jgi:hypothetical protein
VAVGATSGAIGAAAGAVGAAGVAAVRAAMRPYDQITIKTPNPKCRLYWFLIEFIDWRYSQSCWYFPTPLVN